MALNLPRTIKEELYDLTQAKWKSRGIRYLCIRFSTNIDHMIKDSVLNFHQKIKQQCEVWTKLHLSWFGRIAVIKMNVLP